MPTVSVGRDRLFAALGKSYSEFSISQSRSLILMDAFMVK